MSLFFLFFLFFLFSFFLTQIPFKSSCLALIFVTFFLENILDLVIGPSPPFSMQDLIQIGVIVKERLYYACIWQSIIRLQSCLHELGVGLCPKFLSAT